MLHTVDTFVVIILGLIAIGYAYRHITNEVEYVKSKLDGRSYLVRSLPDKAKAADILAEINRDLQKLIKHMKAKYPDDKDIDRLYQNYNPDSISEGSPENGYTSYSVNKGQKLVICIRQVDHSFVDMNVVHYVVIHELAHIMTKEVGHVPVFWENFKRLLKEAIDIGLYNKVDFKNEPADYCSIKIKSSVL